MEDLKMNKKTVRFIITAKADYVSDDGQFGDKSLNCVANEILNTMLKDDKFNDRFNFGVEVPTEEQKKYPRKFFDKSYLQNLRFEPGVADEIEQ